MEFIINYWYIIVALIAVLAVAVVLVARFFQQPSAGQLEKVREWLVYATTLSEKELGSGTGKLKLRMVYDMFVTKFPWVAQVISFGKFSDLVDAALETTNKMLTSNAAVQLYVNGPSEPPENNTAEG